MTGENRRLNLQAELRKGERARRSADTLLRAGLWDDAVSRACYAAYHHVSALLLTQGLEARTHAGLHDLFFLHFVRPGLLPRPLAKQFAGLQQYRAQADYSRAFSFPDAEAREEVTHANELCEAVRSYLATDGWLDEE